MTLADRLQQRPGLLAEHRQEDEILLGGREALGGLAHVLGARTDRLRVAAAGARAQRSPAATRRSDAGVVAVRAFHELPELVADGP